MHDIVFETRKTREADRSPRGECTARHEGGRRVKKLRRWFNILDDLPTDENAVERRIAAAPTSKRILFYYNIIL